MQNDINKEKDLDLNEIDKMNEEIDKCRNLSKIRDRTIRKEKQSGNDSIYKINNYVNRSKVNWINLQVLVWNMQSLNLNLDEAFKKRQFILEMIAKTNPEIVFLIDVGSKVGNFQIMNYRIIHDERNLLAVRFDIKNDVILEKGVFKMKQIDLNFVYMRPMEKNQELCVEIRSMIKKNKCLIGDLNLKSNKLDLKGYDRIIGEITGQTVMLKRKDYKSNVLVNLAPSDHKLIMFSIKRRIIHTSQVQVVGLDDKTTFNVLKDIFESGSLKYDVKIQQIKKILPYNEDARLIDNILDDFIENNTKSIFKRYNYLWKGFKKEPFLGTTIPNKVEEGLKVHYAHNDNKQYLDIPNRLLNFNSDDLEVNYVTGSKAMNNEKFKLHNIDNNLKRIWSIIVLENKSKQAIKNFIDLCNKNKNNMAYTTFYLRKSKILESFNDVRIISIVPIYLKIWENLIYSKVLSYLTNIIDGEGIYQFGGKKNCSTYEAVFKIQEKFFELKGKGILFLDLSKGYDSINWSIFEHDIDNVMDLEIQNLLRIWLILVHNTDALANEDRIKKTRGVGMGLSLAPIVFEYYVHCALVGIKKDRLTMYVDDLSIILDDQGCKLFQNIQKKFAERDLLFNVKKSCLISLDNKIIDDFAKIGIQRKDHEKYLGVVLGLNNNKELITDDRYFKISQAFMCVPKMICFLIRKRIFESAIIARTRYACMMFSIKNRIEKEHLIRYVWQIFKRDFYKLSYIQLILFTLNFSRFFIDLHDMKFIKDTCSKFEVKERMTKAIEIVKEKMLVNIPQWDEVILATKFFIGDPNNWEINMNGIKKLTDTIWKNIKKSAIEIWRKKKAEVGIQVPNNAINLIESKLFINFKVIQAIILRHFDNSHLDFFIFIVNIFINIKLFINNDKFDVNEFKLFNLLINFTDIDVYKMVLETYYKQLDEIMYMMVAIERDKPRCHKLCQFLFILDEIAQNNQSYKKSVVDLMYIFNLKLKIHANYLVKQANVLVENMKECPYEILSSSPEQLDNVIAIDGSADDKGVGGGIVTRYKNNRGVLMDQERICFEVVDENKELRNVAGEMLSLICALEFAVMKKWSEVNIVFDYIGVALYPLNIWKSNYTFIDDIKKKFIKLVQNSHIKINWLKVFSHTNIRLNEMADQTAKIGAKVLPMRYGVTRISQPKLV